MPHRVIIHVWVVCGHCARRCPQSPPGVLSHSPPSLCTLKLSTQRWAAVCRPTHVHSWWVAGPGLEPGQSCWGLAWPSGQLDWRRDRQAKGQMWFPHPPSSEGHTEGVGRAKKDRLPQGREGLSPPWSWEKGEPLSSGGAQGSGGQLCPWCCCRPPTRDTGPLVAGGEAQTSQQGLSGPEPAKTLSRARLPMQTYLEGETAGTVDKHVPVP